MKVIAQLDRQGKSNQEKLLQFAQLWRTSDPTTHLVALVVKQNKCRRGLKSVTLGKGTPARRQNIDPDHMSSRPFAFQSIYDGPLG